MFVFLIAAVRLVVRSRLWRWRSMGRVRLVLLLLGLAWRLAVATRARTSSSQRRPTPWDVPSPLGPRTERLVGRPRASMGRLGGVSPHQVGRRGADALAAVIAEGDDQRSSGASSSARSAVGRLDRLTAHNLSGGRQAAPPARLRGAASPPFRRRGSAPWRPRTSTPGSARDRHESMSSGSRCGAPRHIHHPDSERGAPQRRTPNRFRGADTT